MYSQKRKVMKKLENGISIHCPQSIDVHLFAKLFANLSKGVDLDDLIFSGEEWHKSER